MTRSVVRYSVALCTLALLLGTFGCDFPLAPVPPFSPGEGPLLDFEKVSAPNYELDASTDCFPLTVGGWWRYRDATADQLPTHHPSPGLSEEILGTVVTSDGTQLYVHRAESPDGPVRILYLHRTWDGVYVYGETRDSVQEIYPSPQLLVDLPFEEGKTWTWGEGVVCRVLSQESVTIGVGVFPSCWKLEIQTMLVGLAPASCSCQPKEYRWYARGLGAVKVVKQSKSYELVDSDLISTKGVLVLDWSDNRTEHTIEVGDTTIVQLPAKRRTEYAWTLSDTLNESYFSLRNEEFYDDLVQKNGDPNGIPGTYVAHFEALSPTPADAPVLLELNYLSPFEIEAAHSFFVEIEVR